jgi:hypothetical protein
VLDTRLDPRQTMVACLDQWRAGIVGCDDTGLPGDAAPLTVTMQVARVTIAAENGDQIVLAPQQIEPLVHSLDCINDYLTYGES